MATRTPKPTGDAALHLFDPRRGDLPFRLETFTADRFSQPQRFNYFTVLWIPEGQGVFHADLSRYALRGPTLLFFNPYQTLLLASHGPIRGTVLQFHANFFCIETYHEAVGCNGVLFNDIYGQPMVPIDPAQAAEFAELLSQMEAEIRTAGLAHTEVLVALLKVFLIKATRLKLAREQASPPASAVSPGATAAPAPHPVLARLIELIELDFRTAHSPAHYAAALHITAKALARIVKAHFGRTTGELVRERILKHAKWQLLHTTHPVKEIADQVGFADELYFSRLFKRATGFSPTAFRTFETAIRGGANLSM